MVVHVPVMLLLSVWWYCQAVIEMSAWLPSWVVSASIVHDRSTSVSLPTAVNPVGALGSLAAVADASSEAVLSPAGFWARTWKVYSVLTVRPVTV